MLRRRRVRVLEVPVRALSHDGVWFADPDIPRFRETGSLIRDHDLGCALASAIGDGPGCLIPHHGLVTVGTTVAEAVMPRLSRPGLPGAAARDVGRWSAHVVGPREVERKRADVWTPEQVAAGFDTSAVPRAATDRSEPGPDRARWSANPRKLVQRSHTGRYFMPQSGGRRWGEWARLVRDRVGCGPRRHRRARRRGLASR